VKAEFGERDVRYGLSITSGGHLHCTCKSAGFCAKLGDSGRDTEHQNEKKKNSDRRACEENEIMPPNLKYAAKNLR
jgi:hypothetical protein